MAIFGNKTIGHLDAASDLTSDLTDAVMSADRVTMLRALLALQVQIAAARTSAVADAYADRHVEVTIQPTTIEPIQ